MGSGNARGFGNLSGRTMNPIIVIPARLESTRLKNKLLLDETEHPLIWHTVLSAQNTGYRTVVATDSRKIGRACYPICASLYTGEASSGTERISKVVEHEIFQNHDVVINWQGDEPDIPPESISGLLEALESHDVATIASPADHHEIYDINTVKVVINHSKQALYFSRQQIPGYKHIGIYAYKKSFLENLDKQIPSAYEVSENLEQLRWLHNGYSIGVHVTNHYSIGIDTREDYDRFLTNYFHRMG